MKPIASLMTVLLAALGTDGARAAADVTFNRDVAPILFKHCASCHRPGEVGPFPLLTYKDAAKRAKHLAEVIAERRMPPWHAGTGQHRFLDERRLSDAEIGTVARWARGGAKEGDPADLPKPPELTDGWQLGPPDLIVRLPKPFEVPAEGQTLRVFSVPIPVREKKWIKAIEFRPGNRKVVHHANLFLDPTGEMRKHAPKGDALVADLNFDRPALQAFPGLIGAWTPGHMPRPLPGDIAHPLRPGTDLVFQIHYQPSGKLETDQSCVGIYLTDRPGTKYAVPVPLSISPPFKNTALLDIPAGKKAHRVELSAEIPTDGFVYAVHTHAHYLLHDITLTATPPGGKAATLLRIPRWDFNWQDRYVYADPPRLPKGTRLDLVANFDNTADNPQNPNSPPKDIHFGVSSTDEMLNCVLVLLPERTAPIPPAGVAIPKDAKTLREKFDTDKDGRLSPDEIAALPPRIRLKIEALIAEQESLPDPKKVAQKADPPPKVAPAAGPLQLPPGGFVLPADARLLREKYDLDKDGKLSQKELEAIAQPLRVRVEDMIRKRLDAGAKTREASDPELLPSPRVIAAAIPPVVAGEVTFTKDVAPILFKHCASCHRPGEVGPFPLLTYRDAARRAKHLAEVAAERRMPPWLPEPGPHRFLDERRLSDAELAVLERWARTGARQGDPADLPAPPKFTDGWQLGPPDLIIKMPKPFTVPAEGADVYQAFVIPVPVDQLRWVKGFEFRPGNRKVVHHANLLLDATGKLRERAEKADGPGFRTNAGVEARQNATGALGGWRPGTTARFLADGFARGVRPGTDVVFNVHYHPSGKAEEDQSSLGLYFTDKPGQKRTFNISLFVSPDAGNARLLDIPAGEKRHKVALTKIVPADAVVNFVTPHAHYLLKEMTLTATRPGGPPEPLLEIKNWDFNQQDVYYFAELVKLPKGTRLDLVGSYDNSAENLQNPSNPPQDVHWGERTTDEMFAVVLGIVPDGDEAAEKYRQLFGKGAKGVPAAKGKTPEAAGPVRLPPGGFDLPANANLLRSKYDTDKDGKLSQKELEAIPQPLRGRVEDMIRQRLDADAKGRKTSGPELLPAPRTQGGE
jgi:mono/diheme cytochrome c family protein